MDFYFGLSATSSAFCHPHLMEALRHTPAGTISPPQEQPLRCLLLEGISSPVWQAEEKALGSIPYPGLVWQESGCEWGLNSLSV